MSDNSKTFYNGNKGKASNDFENQAEIKGTPYTNRDKMREWQGEIVNEIHDLIEGNIEGKKLDAIGSKDCHIYVTFYVANTADVDNLQKAFFDALNKPDNPNHPLYKYAGEKSFLLEDDGSIKGVKVQREIIRPGEEPRVKFVYLITKTFFIERADPIKKKELQRDYRSYWNDSMQLITAREIIDGKEGGEVKFIDNACGAVYISSKTKSGFPEAIPGYNWKDKERKVVEGCIVFNKTHSRKQEADKKKDESFWWIKRWPDSF